MPVRISRLRRGLALGLGAVLLLACGDSATDTPADDDDDGQSSSGGSSSSSSGGRSSSSSSGRPGTSSSSSSGGSSSSGSSTSSSSGGSSGSSSSSSSSGGSSGASSSSSSSGGSSGQVAQYTVGGTITGYAGSGLQLRTGNETLTIAPGAASWVFAGSFATDDAYAVTVATQPSQPAQTCLVTNGSGVVDGENVDDVQVTCITNPVLEPLGGMVFGLTGPGLVLANGADEVAVDADSEFFLADVAVGTEYEVTVKTNPPGQVCTVTDGQGVMVDGGFDDVLVECVTSASPGVNVTVSGLESDSVVVLADVSRTVTANGSFTYDLATGTPYSVTVTRNPRSPRQTCTVQNGQGTVQNARVEVAITCVSDCVQLVINEVQVAGAENANQEFVEVYNKGTCEADFNDYKIQYKSDGNGNGLALSANKKIPAGGYFVFGTTQYGGTRNETFAAGLGGNGQLAILLKTTNQPVDGVVWGNVPAGTYVEGTRAAAPGTRALARVPNGKDTHDNSADFTVQNATPAAAN